MHVVVRAPKDNGGAAPGLPERDLGAIARAHAERADAISEGLNINDEAFAKLNADLRKQLANMGVPLERIEIEFERVMAAVFKGPARGCASPYDPA